MSQVITHSASSILAQGANELANAVKTTLGPKGRNVVIEAPYGNPYVTKDGVTVAKSINLEDPIKNMGANILKQAALNTARLAGDGTTTSTVLAQALLEAGDYLTSEGYSPIEVKRGFDLLTAKTIEVLSANSHPTTLEDVLSIATLSANNDPHIGSIVHEAFSFVSLDGTVSIEDSKIGKTHVETTPGAVLPTSYISPYFVTDPNKMEVNFDKPLIFVTDRKLRSAQEMLPLLQIVSTSGRPLLIIADDVDGQALSLLLVNKLRANLPVVAIKAPAYSDRRFELLKDIAALTSSKLFTDQQGLRPEDVTLQDLGTTEKLTITPDKTILINPKSSPLVQERHDSIQALLQSSPDSYTEQKLLERQGNLKGKIAVIYVGAPTETEAKEIKDRVDDALRATRSAIHSGYQEGAGYAYIKALRHLPSDSPIEQAFQKALTSVYYQVLANADILPQEIIPLNAATNTPTNYYEDGIIDPTFVLTEALSNANSAATMIILSAVSVHNTKRETYNPGSLDQYAN